MPNSSVFHPLSVIDLSTFRTEEDAIHFNYVCPRCGHRQSASMDPIELVICGKMFTCANTAVCGERNMDFKVHGLTPTFLDKLADHIPTRSIIGITAADIEWVTGSYNGPIDVPLSRSSE